MTAKQLRYFGPRKSRRVSSRKRKGAEVVIVKENPRRGSTVAKKRRHHRRKHRRSFLSNPRRRTRRFYRNPISSGQGFLGATIVPAAIGAAGAVGGDWLLGMLPVPREWCAGPGTQTLARILAALGVGWIVGAVTTEKTGAEAAAGGIVVALYSLFRPWAAQNLPFRMARYVPMGTMLGNRGRMRRFVPMRGIPQGKKGTMVRTNGPTRLRARGGLGGLKGWVSPARTSGPQGGAMPRMTRGMARYAAQQIGG